MQCLTLFPLDRGQTVDPKLFFSYQNFELAIFSWSHCPNFVANFYGIKVVKNAFFKPIPLGQCWVSQSFKSFFFSRQLVYWNRNFFLYLIKLLNFMSHSRYFIDTCKVFLWVKSSPFNPFPSWTTGVYITLFLDNSIIGNGIFSSSKSNF